MIASQTGLAIVPVGIGFVRAFRFQSWDRFALPLPFSMMVGVVGDPIFVPRELDRTGLTHWAERVQGEMLKLTALADEWANRIRHEGVKAPMPVVAPTSAMRKSA
jgi:lysophospholipid acyltransferase (LPLAT)-like uncharacterized protein